MAVEIPLVSVSLATVSIESFLFGIYLVLFITSISLLVSRYGIARKRGRHAGRPGPGQNLLVSPVFLGPIVLCFTITGHWILTVDRSFLAFVYFEDGTFPLAFYGNLSHITEVVKTGLASLALVIGDLLIIHRLWVVWGRDKYVVIFPLCTLVGLTICGGGITYQLSQYEPGENIFLSAAGRWITSDTVFTLCTNLYCTSLITWRLWQSSRAIKPIGDRSLSSLLVILVESAALYTIWTLFFFISYQTKSNLQFIVLDCWPAVSGISCMLIHVRVGLRWAKRSNSAATASVQLQPFAVNIQRVVETTSNYQLDDLRRVDKATTNV